VNVTGVSESRKFISTGFYLEQNNPNPFNKLTTIQFNMPYQARVSIIITNSYGKVVDKLISSLYDAGSYKFEFLADGLQEGTYFCHLVADRFSDTREMELTK
jgi:hypothetical protein